MAAQSLDQVEWLVARTVLLCNEWLRPPDPARQIFCSKFKPRDGIEAPGPTEMFPRRPLEHPIRAPAVGSPFRHGEKEIASLAVAKSLDLVPYEEPPDYAHLERCGVPGAASAPGNLRSSGCEARRRRISTVPWKKRAEKEGARHDRSARPRNTYWAESRLPRVPEVQWFADHNPAFPGKLGISMDLRRGAKLEALTSRPHSSA